MVDRKDQLAREEGRREEELRLLRLQVEKQSEAVNRSADLVGRSTGYSRDSTGVAFPMSVRNVGNTVARDVEVWLSIASPDNSDPVGTPAVTPRQDLGVLAANDPASTSASSNKALQLVEGYHATD